jgi:DNA-binding IclR family transcriptional regulator
MNTDIKSPKTQKPEGVAAVDRALSILLVLEQAQEPLTISELARQSSLYKSTALRLLGSLRKFGTVNKTKDNRYELGPAVLRLGMAYQRNSRLEEKLMPVCRKLVLMGSESVSFFIPQDQETRLCVFRLDSNHSTLDRVRQGIVLPIDCGAAGHIIKAFKDPASDDLHQRIRDQGFALSLSETSPDCAAVAAPVFDEKNALIGALSISGPRSRFTEEAIQINVAHVIEASHELCRSFGGPS